MRRGIIFVAALLLFTGCQSRPERVQAPVAARFMLESDSGRTAKLVLPLSGVGIQVLAKPVISEFDVVNAELAQVDLGQCLMFQVSPAAGRDLYRLSASNQGRRLVLLLNDVPAGARVIDRPLEGGVIYVFCEIPDAELPALVERIKATSAEIMREAAKH